MKNTTLVGIALALLAALLNGSIGIFSKKLMQSGFSVQDIAFFKTLIAFLFLSFLLLRRSFTFKDIVIDDRTLPKTYFVLLLQIAVCAFLGIFVLFFFETLAYGYGFASNVVVILMASAAISALVFEIILLGERPTLSAFLGATFAILGIFVISWAKGDKNLTLMTINAAAAGAGYGLFSVFIKKFRLVGGLRLTQTLMFFGTVYLFFPYLIHQSGVQWNVFIILNLLALALLPTILGFYCTTKALNCLSASKVQVVELSEPIFAAVLAWIFLTEIPKVSFFMGAGLIVVGILLINGLYPRRT